MSPVIDVPSRKYKTLFLWLHQWFKIWKVGMKCFIIQKHNNVVSVDVSASHSHTVIGQNFGYYTNIIFPRQWQYNLKTCQFRIIKLVNVWIIFSRSFQIETLDIFPCQTLWNYLKWFPSKIIWNGFRQNSEAFCEFS